MEKEHKPPKKLICKNVKAVVAPTQGKRRGIDGRGVQIMETSYIFLYCKKELGHKGRHQDSTGNKKHGTLQVYEWDNV